MSMDMGKHDRTRERCTDELAAIASALRSCRMSTTYVLQGESTKSTPSPFTKSSTRLSARPTLPGTYCVTRPAQRIEHGTMTAAPAMHARRRSSGTQVPPRRLRHWTTIRSEMRPEMGAPTAGALGIGGAEEGGERTEVAGAEGDAKGPEKRFVLDAIPLALDDGSAISKRCARGHVHSR